MGKAECFHPARQPATIYRMKSNRTKGHAPTCPTCGQYDPLARSREVARLYLEAQQRGLETTGYVARHLGIGTRHATQLVYRARHKYGLLSPVNDDSRELAAVS